MLKGDRRYILNNGIQGIYVLHWAKGYWWNHGLNSYLAGRCFYDVSLDPYDLIRDYAIHYFGNNAGQLLAAYYTQWATNVDLVYHVRDGANESDRKMLAEQRRLWIAPAVEAVKGDPILSHRVGKVEKLHRTAEMLAEAHRIREEIAELLKAGDIAGARKLLQKAKIYTDEVIAYMATIAELNQGLIDRNEVSGFITLGVKGWIKEREKELEEAAK